MGKRVVSWYFSVLVIIFFSFQQIPGFHCVRDSTVLVGSETDRLALLEFRSKITDGPLGILASWNESIHFCQWYGVPCSRKHQRVTFLNLESLKLAGSLSPHIGNFSFLQLLNLQNNSFSHEIPSEISRLQRLKFLILKENSFSGEIPANLSSCSNLLQANLSFNYLVGKIPSEFGSWSNIELLALQHNRLTGNIPTSLGNLSSITQLRLSYNKLDGTIPETFGFLKNLMVLALAENRLTGTIPYSIFNISSIGAFDVGDNQIEGNIPLDLGFTLPNLEFFSVAKNHITGPIPPSISNASKLEVFGIGENNMTGEVPDLEKLTRLYYFEVSINSLGSGRHNDLNFICSLTSASGLKILGINANNFGGLIPARCFSNISTTLTMLRMDNNKISGTIPTVIGKFVNLKVLEMWHNNLSGTIPPVIGELQNLTYLFLDRNILSGHIPSSIGNLKKLLKLDLSNNFLQGSIPFSLDQCQRLLQIDLSNNYLSGTIPAQVIALSSLTIGLNFSGNQLTGFLPTEVGRLVNLGNLDVSWNMLEGKIPSTLSSCISLEYLRMQGNLFRGSIPSSLNSLKGLRVLDLSQNNLSGEIPKLFVGLKLLENLNLSYNELEDVVPTEGVFKNVNATSVLGNSKLCGGIPQFQLPTCGSNKSKGGGLTQSLKLIIAVISGLVGIAFALSFLCLFWAKKRKLEKSNPNNSINSLLNLSCQKLYNATNGFSSANLIGAGSFGSVYKGILDEGKTIVAVKVFDLLHHGASKSFLAECVSLRNIRHRNLLKVLTACSGVDYQSNDFKALVYEFMRNGNLEEWLHPVIGDDDAKEAPRSLNLLQRLNIAIDVACALNYLHHDCLPPIIHCDLKPSNVLLDDEMTAHVGDFGLARFLPPAHKQTSSIGVKGSIGYIAPEYGFGSDVSINGDVYSYGIMLLELITRKKPTNNMFDGDMNVHNFARMAMLDHPMDIVDLKLLNDDEDWTAIGDQKQTQARINGKIECLSSMIRIGVACSMESLQDRMNITNIVHELQSIKNTLLEPKSVFEHTNR